MKVFFTGSPRSLKASKPLHTRLYNLIEKVGHTNLSRLVIDADPELFYEKNYDERKQHFIETSNNLLKADIVVVELSLTSLSMGFLVNMALEYKKPTIVLYTNENEPFFLTGIENPLLQIIPYTPKNLEKVLEVALDFATIQQQVRFNLSISPSLLAYLKFVSRKSGISKSDIIRRLVRDKMIRDDTYFRF